MSIKRYLLASLLALSACSDKKDFPDAVVSSKGLETDKLNVSIVTLVQTETRGTGTTTQISVDASIYTYGKYNFAQFVELADTDLLSLQYEDQAATLTPNLVPDQQNPLYVEYVIEFDLSDLSSPITASFSRDNSTIFDQPLSILNETPLEVTIDGGTLDLSNQFTVTWEPIADYTYSIKLSFSCITPEEQKIYVTKKFPNYTVTELTSPFVFDMTSLPDLPADQIVDSCEVAVALISKQDQTPTQTVFSGGLELTSARTQKIVIPIVLDPLL